MESTLDDNERKWKTFTDWILNESHTDNNFYQIRLTTNTENMKALLNRHSSFKNLLLLNYPPINYLNTRIFSIFTHIINMLF